ncbi:unnamed protein product [Discula destructiva]
MAERQKIIETNRSIRTIKNELESLLEKDIITYDSYQSIHNLLPAEASLNSRTPQPNPQPAAAAAPPTAALANLNLAANHPPPSYHQTTAAAPPTLPTRNTPAPPPPSKPVIAHAKALYAYTASDARDVGFDRGDAIQVYEYMNADWWMGRNERTGAEGIFPRTYVETTTTNEKAAAAAPFYGSPAPAAAAGGGYGGYPAPPAQQNPYNSSAPPMAVANPDEGGEGGKAGGMGKKFGKKLGNAAIFGAGATIGSNIVNSIF